MFSLSLGPAKNLARAISGSGGGGKQNTKLMNGVDSSEQKHVGGWSRSAPSKSNGGGIPCSMPASTPRGFIATDDEEGNDHAEEEDDQHCDPLMYRLQHQKRYIKEKQSKKRSERVRRSLNGLRRRGSRGSKSSRSSSNKKGATERDPFDLWGSLTSDDRSSNRDEDEKSGSQVDDVGWGSSSPRSSRSRRRSSISNLSDHGEEEDKKDDDENNTGLYLDFGGVAPLDQQQKYGRSRSDCHLDEMEHYRHPNSARHTFSARDNQQQGNDDLLIEDFQPYRHKIHTFPAEQQADDDSLMEDCQPYQQKVHDLMEGFQPRDHMKSNSEMEPHQPAISTRFYPVRRTSSGMNNEQNEHMLMEDFQPRQPRHTYSAGENLDDDFHIGFHPQRDGMKSSHSTFSTLSNDPLTDYHYRGGDEQSRDEAYYSRQPSQADLSKILSSLERASMSASLESGDPIMGGEHEETSTSPKKFSELSSAMSTLSMSSPTELARESFLFPPAAPPTLPISTPGAPSMDSPFTIPNQQPQHEMQECDDLIINEPPQPPRIPSPPIAPPQPPQRSFTPQQEEEEEDPQLAQLRQQTTEELRLELSKMQTLSKTNLEKSWAETERMRVENSELDDKLEEIRKELAIARAGLMSQPARRGTNVDDQQSKDSSASQFIITKFAPTSRSMQPKSKFRRRRTIDSSESLTSGINDIQKSISTKSLVNLIPEETDDELDISVGCKSTLTSAVGRPPYRTRPSRGTSSFQRRPSIGSSYSLKSNYSPSAIKALMGNESQQHDSRHDDRSSSGKASSIGGFLGNLGESFFQGKISSGSVSSGVSDFDMGFGVDTEYFDTNSNVSDDTKEFSEQIYQSLLAPSASTASIPQSAPVQNSQIRNTKDDFADENSESNSSDAMSGVFYPPPTSTSIKDGKYSEDDSSDAQSRVFYPPLAKPDDAEEVNFTSEQSVSQSVTDNASIGGFTEMDDFDFDPFKEIMQEVPTKPELSTFMQVPTKPERKPERSNSDSSGTKEKLRPRSGFVRRPSFMNLFDEKCDTDTDSENVPKFMQVPTKPEWKPERSSSDASGTKKKLRPRSGFVRRPSFMNLFDGKFDTDTDSENDNISPPIPHPKKKKGKRAERLTDQIQEADNELEQLGEEVRVQENGIESCDAEIVDAGIQSTEVENSMMEKEAALQAEVHALEERKSANESRLDHVEASEQNARERENDLKEKLSRVNEHLHKRTARVEPERQLSSCQQYYNNTQENAIEALSELLKTFDSMGIPSLRGDNEDGISGDIIARFDSLTDKEEDLVATLSDADRRSICQSSFQQVQKNIEMAMHWKNQLQSLQTDLQGHLSTIMLLMKQDGDEWTHTTDSSTSSERISIERVFVEATISLLESVEQNQGKLVLGALSESLEFLTYWDQWLLPDNSVSTDPSKSSNINLNAVVSTILKAKAELTEVKLQVLNENAKFKAKMRGTGFRPCNRKNLLDHNDSDQQLSPGNAEESGIKGEISEQISTTDRLLLERQSVMDKYTSFFHGKHLQARTPRSNSELLGDILEENESEQLEELDFEISKATAILSERESMMDKYASELASLQALAQEDSNENLQLTNEIQMKIKQVLSQLAEEESFIATLESLLQEKREQVTAVEYSCDA